MPEYVYVCPFGHQMSRFTNVKNHRPFVDCEHCGVLASQVITAPLLVKVAQDVCYDSPIDGMPITSWDKRSEDLKRHDCVPYDPEMKDDHIRRMQEHETALDQSIYQSVERAVAQMPTKKRGQLYSELTEQGVAAEARRA